MRKQTIAFIGGGNMASSLIGGLIAGGFDSSKIWVADPDLPKLQNLALRYAIHTSNNNAEAVAEASIIVLAVKPQTIKDAALSITDTVSRTKALIISVAAGIRVSALNQWLGADVPVIRTMPNTPALIQSGATALYANSHVSEEQRSAAESLLRSVGLTTWLNDEIDMDAVTALSGSGPAYFFQVMQAMEDAAIGLGLDPATAHLLTLQTAFGAAKMALESNESIVNLRARVTSPGGTTEQAITVLEQGNISGLFRNALLAAQLRSKELADLFEGTQP